MQQSPDSPGAASVGTGPIKRTREYQKKKPRICIRGSAFCHVPSLLVAGSPLIGTPSKSPIDFAASATARQSPVPATTGMSYPNCR